MTKNAFVICFMFLLFHLHFVWAFCSGIFLNNLCSYLTFDHGIRSLNCIFFSPPSDPGFWVVSESEYENLELRSYDSAEYESEEIDSAAEEEEGVEGEYGEEEYGEEEYEEEKQDEEIEESDNDMEVMNILAEAQKQNQTQSEKRTEQPNPDKNEETELPTVNKSKSVANISSIERTETKVCECVTKKAQVLSFAKSAYDFDFPRIMNRYHHPAMVAFQT